MELNNITTVSESGGHLKILLSHWMKKSLDFGVSMLKRLLLVYPFTIENPEETQLEPVQMSHLIFNSTIETASLSCWALECYGF